MNYEAIARMHDFISLAEKDPRTAIKELGLNISDDTQIRVTRNTATLMHVVLPPEPTHPVSDDEMREISGGIGMASPQCGYEYYMSQINSYTSPDHGLSENDIREIL